MKREEFPEGTLLWILVLLALAMAAGAALVMAVLIDWT